MKHIRTFSAVPREKWRSLLAGAVGALVLAGGVAVAMADGDHRTSTVNQPPRVIPYQGNLLVDGRPANRSVPMTFTLHAGVACTDCAIWTESQQVTVTQGRFSVALGAVTPVDSVVTNAEKVYLSMVADGVPLSGRQALDPAAYAYWTGGARDALPVSVLRPVAGQSAVEVGGSLSVPALVKLTTARKWVLERSTTNRLSINASRGFNNLRFQSNVTGRVVGSPLGFNSLVLGMAGSDLTVTNQLRVLTITLPGSTNTVTAPTGTRFTVSRLANLYPDCGGYAANAVRLKQQVTAGEAGLELLCAKP